MLQTTATDASTRLPRTSDRSPTRSPSSTTSFHTRDERPAWGSIAEWNFSAPNRLARNWKNMIASAPRARCDMLLRASSPGRFATLRGCQFTADVECSMSTHGLPAASERVKSASIASSTCASEREAVR